MLAALTFTACASSFAADLITGYDLVKRQQTASTDAVVEYCHQNSPQSSRVVNEGYAVYLSSLQSAMTSWIAEKPDMQKNLERNVPANSSEVREVNARMQDIHAAILNSVKQYEPAKYCPWVAGKLKATTPESLLKTLHEYDARVRQKLQGK